MNKNVFELIIVGIILLVLMFLLNIEYKEETQKCYKNHSVNYCNIELSK